MKKINEKNKKITFNINKESHFSKWFSEIISKAGLADLRYNVKGFVVFKPWAVIAMEKIYNLFEKELQEKGHEPAWFPAVIPEKNFKLESEHIQGFTPQVFWITNAAGKPLKEKLAMRPTSETAMYQMYSLWIRSYKDLPLKIYQRAQVWRYETKATRPFIRSREFYWIEAHDCFPTKEKAEEQVLEDISITEKIMHQKLGIPFLPLKRPSWDRFPGAVYTIGSDSLMPDGKIIQQPSTHFLGQGFSKVFNIKFKDKDEKERYVWQTCYGPAVSRIMASVIAMHGDNSGLIFPFCISPIQVIIVPILTSQDKEKVMRKSKEILNKLGRNNIRAKVDDKEISPGEKYYFWEMKGIPFRIEVGEKEIKDKQITLFTRDLKKRRKIKEKDLEKEILKEGEKFDKRLKEKADKFFEKSIVNVSNFNELKNAISEGKIARCNFCSIDKEGEKCAEKIEKKLFAFVRGARHDRKEKPFGDKKCIICGKPAKEVVYIAKSY